MSKSNAGFILLHRSILDWEWYEDLKTFRLFIFCLLRANYKDGRFEGIDIKRGSFASSLQKLSDNTGLSVREVRTALNHLEGTGELTVKTTPKFSVITVTKYDLYQAADMRSDKATTDDRQAIGKPSTASKRNRTGKQGSRKAIAFYDFAERKDIDFEGVQNRLISKNFSDPDKNAMG